MPGRHSAKQKRQAKHVAASERKRGYSAKQAESIGWATVNKQTRKSDDASSAQPPPAISRRPTKPTIKMKPITDHEAAANLRAGKFIEKGHENSDNSSVGSERPTPTTNPPKPANMATATSTTTTPRSGAGAPVTKGFQLTKRSATIQLVSMEDMMKSMQMMPRQSGPAKPPSLYLPGSHRTDSPVRKPMGLKKKPSQRSADDASSVAKAKKQLKMRQSGFKLRGSGIKEALDTGSVKKSESNINKGTTMSDELEDLFKSEIGNSDSDKPIIHCPHCEEAITKSQVLAKAKGQPVRKVAGDNKAGKHHRGAESGRNDGTPTRGGSDTGKKKNKGTPERRVVSDNKGGAHKRVAKGEEMSYSASSDDDMSKSEASCPKCKNMVKAGTQCKCGMILKSDGETFELPPPSMQHPRIRGTEYVQYVDTGEDARIAKMIESGSMGGAHVTQPMDKNNSARR